jgi:hypothetical protein
MQGNAGVARVREPFRAKRQICHMRCCSPVSDHDHIGAGTAETRKGVVDTSAMPFRFIPSATPTPLRPGGCGLPQKAMLSDTRAPWSLTPLANWPR